MEETANISLRLKRSADLHGCSDLQFPPCLLFRLTVTLDQLSLNLSRTSNTSQVVQPNLVVQSAQIQASDTQGVQFTTLAGQWVHASWWELLTADRCSLKCFTDLIYYSFRINQTFHKEKFGADFVTLMLRSH